MGDTVVKAFGLTDVGLVRAANEDSFTMAELSVASTPVDSSTFCTSPMMFSIARLMAWLPVSCSLMARLRCLV